MRKNKIILTAFALLTFLALIYLLWYFPLDQLIDKAGLARFIEHIGWIGVPLFLAGGALSTAAGMPRQLVAFIGGYSFGLWPGLALATLAATVGCFLSFWFSRRFLQAWVAARYTRAVHLLDGFVNEDAFLKIVALRLQPFGTNLVTNLSAGVSQIQTSVFIFSSLLGFIPQMLVFALLGSGIRVHSETQLMVSSVLFALSILLGWFLYRRHCSRQSQSVEHRAVSPER